MGAIVEVSLKVEYSETFMDEHRVVMSDDDRQSLKQK